jgi:uncharacterized membrane protein
MKNKNQLLIYCIILSAVMVVTSILSKSLWGDEIWSVRSATLSWENLIVNLSEDYHPPAYFILLKIWIYFFGFGEVALRAFQFVLGSCFLYSVVLLFNTLLPNKRIHIFFILFSLSGELWLFLPMLRYYVLTATLVVLSTYLLFSWFNNEKKTYFYYLMICYTLMLYTDYPSGIVLIIHFVYLLIVKKEFLRNYIILMCITCLMFMPWVIILISQISKLIRFEQIADFNASPIVLFLKVGYSFYAFIFSEVVYPFEILIVTSALLLTAILFFGINYTKLKIVKHQIGFNVVTIIVGILFTSVLTTFISRHTSFIYTPSRTFFVLPFVYLFFAFIYESLKDKKWKISFITLFLILNLYSIYNYAANKHFLMPVYASPWKTLLFEIKNEKSLILADEMDVYQYYASYLEGEFPETINPDTPEQLKEIMEQKGVNSVYILLLGRESTEPTINTKVVEYIKQKFKKVSEKKYLLIDESYRKIKNKMLNRDSYDAKFLLQKFILSTE